MKNPLFWRFIAWLVTRPWLRDRIIAYAMRQRCRKIYEGDSLYLTRYFIAEQKWWLPRGIKLHFIHRPDNDRAKHDHPWPFRTIVLKGGYKEENIYGVRYRIGAGDTYYSPAIRFHRIDTVDEGTVTLVFTGKREQEWGFLTTGLRHGEKTVVKVPWRIYLNMKGLSAGDDNDD